MPPAVETHLSASQPGSGAPRPTAPERLLGGVAGLAAAELVAAAASALGPTDAVARLVADRLPLPVVELAVHRLHRRDKAALRLASAAALAGLGTRSAEAGRSTLLSAGLAAGVTAAALQRPPRRFLAALAVAIAQAMIGPATTRVARRRPAAVAVGTAVAVAASLGVRRRRGAAASADPPGESPFPSGDTLLDGAEGWDHPTPLITPLDLFHVTDTSFGTPLVRPEGWRLRVAGDDLRPTAIDWSDLVDLGATTVDAALVCIHNRIGWERAANARWHAVPLDAVRDLVGVPPTAHVATTAVDGFTISVPVAELAAAGLGSFVVVGMNGRPLRPAHGYPARFFVPGLYGQFAGVKWLEEIRFTDRHVPGDWERRGWPPTSVMAQPHARIDGVRRSGASTVVSGVAWAPPAGVAAVEVSVDGGPWTSAHLARALGPFAWRRWQSRVVIPRGRHRVRARVLGADGRMQDGARRPPFPAGVTGYHGVRVTVRS